MLTLRKSSETLKKTRDFQTASTMTHLNLTYIALTYISLTYTLTQLGHPTHIRSSTSHLIDPRGIGARRNNRRV